MKYTFTIRVALVQSDDPSVTVLSDDLLVVDGTTKANADIVVNVRAPSLGKATSALSRALSDMTQSRVP